MDRFYGVALLGGIVLDQQLFQVKERLPLVRLLPDLYLQFRSGIWQPFRQRRGSLHNPRVTNLTHTGRPSVLGFDPPAVIAHLVVHHIIHREALLQNGPSNGFSLNGQFHLFRRINNGRLKSRMNLFLVSKTAFVPLATLAFRIK